MIWSEILNYLTKYPNLLGKLDIELSYTRPFHNSQQILLLFLYYFLKFTSSFLLSLIASIVEYLLYARQRAECLACIISRNLHHTLWRG